MRSDDLQVRKRVKVFRERSETVKDDRDHVLSSDEVLPWILQSEVLVTTGMCLRSRIGAQISTLSKQIRIYDLSQVGDVDSFTDREMEEYNSIMKELDMENINALDGDPCQLITLLQWTLEKTKMIAKKMVT